MRGAEGFALHPRLEADTWFVTDLPLCRVLLMNDARYPWLIAVPRVPGLVEMDELTPAEFRAFGEESRQILAVLRQVCQPHKLNVAALGNQVEQLHVHHIARYREDAAWPAPVWGAHPPQAYAAHERDSRLTALRAALCG